MSSSPPHLTKQKTPFIYHHIDSNTHLNRKYAPKFTNHLTLIIQRALQFRARYIKKASVVDSFSYWLESTPHFDLQIRRITKRFKKSLKGKQQLGPNILSSFPSLKSCQLTRAFHLPLYFKLGRFSKLLIKFRAVNIELLSAKNYQFYLTNIKRFRFLKNLSITIDHDNLNTTIPLLLELQKYPQILSSLQDFELHYQNTTHGRNALFVRNLTNLPCITQSITHFFIKAKLSRPLQVILRDFSRLKLLSVDVTSYSNKDDILNLISLISLQNLEILIIQISLNDKERIEHFFSNFQPPKSLKKLHLILKLKYWTDSLPFPLILDQPQFQKKLPEKSFFPNIIQSLFCCKRKKTISQEVESSPENHFEQWDATKGLREKLHDLENLSDLTLDFECSPSFQDINFFFMASLLNGFRHGLRRLTLKTTCPPNQQAEQYSSQDARFLRWDYLLQLLKPFKDTLEYLEISARKINFNDFAKSSNFTFNKLKSFKIDINEMKTEGFSRVFEIIPKQIYESRFKYNIILRNGEETTRLFNHLRFIPRSHNLCLEIQLSKLYSGDFEKALLDFLSLVRIEGYMSIYLHQNCAQNSAILGSEISKAVKLNWHGYLIIYYDRFKVLFKLRKSNIIYCINE